MKIVKEKLSEGLFGPSQPSEGDRIVNFILNHKEEITDINHPNAMRSWGTSFTFRDEKFIISNDENVIRVAPKGEEGNTILDISRKSRKELMNYLEGEMSKANAIEMEKAGKRQSERFNEIKNKFR